MKAKIYEIFQSIQGEGRYAGVPQVFVRFSGCNLNCSWCDSAHANNLTPGEFKEMDPLEVWASIEKLWRGCHSLSLTGGEPLMQLAFLKELLAIIKVYKMRTYLETNGTLPDALREIVDDIDIISMDVKLPSSTGCAAYWDEHVKFMRVAWGKEIFIKTVISQTTSMEDIVKAVEMICKGDPTIPLFLQPNYFDMDKGVMEKCQHFLEYCSNFLGDVRILPQMHKFMNLR